MGFKGVYLSEGIADLVAGVITSVVIFTTFPRIFKKRQAEVLKDLSEDIQHNATVDCNCCDYEQ